MVDLRAELDAYREELESARLQPLAVRTYTERSETFIRWLDGRYTSRGPNRVDTMGSRGMDDSWLDEAAVQQRVVAWLEQEGWNIIRQAHGRERGTDIDAERDGERLSVEVKGHPRRIHSFGVNTGKPRKWHPGAQARTYFGNAVHAALTMLHADPERQVAIALPDMSIYRGQVERSRSPLHTPSAYGSCSWPVTERCPMADSVPRESHA
jgi:Holliday junction resolvase-like predicted endonuclease